MLKVKLQYFGHLMQRADSVEKTLMLGKTDSRRRRGWHHWHNGHEFEQTPGDSEGQVSRLCCSPGGCKQTQFSDWKQQLGDYAHLLLSAPLYSLPRCSHLSPSYTHVLVPPPVHLPRPSHSPRGQIYVPNCQVHPDVTWASQHIQTKSIIFLFNLSPSSNPCSSKWYHHPLWPPKTWKSPSASNWSHGIHSLLFMEASESSSIHCLEQQHHLFRAAHAMEPICHLSRLPQRTLVVKNLPANAGDSRDSGSIPGSGRSPGGGHGNSLQYSCLENPMDRGAWWATVHRSQSVGHDWSDLAHTFARLPLRFLWPFQTLKSIVTPLPSALLSLNPPQKNVC